MDAGEQPQGRPEAILRPSAAAPVLDVSRHLPAPRLRACVAYYWYVGWDTAAPHHQQVLVQPRVHVAAEQGRLMVQPVTREPFDRVLRGRGHVLGAAFRPAGFRPLLGRAVGSLGLRVPAGDVLGVDDRPAAEQILGTTDVAAMTEAMDAYLTSVLPSGEVGEEAATAVERVDALVAEAERDRTMTRAEELAAYAGLSLRSLQRLFTEHVGIGPKWVVQRCRVLDAAAAAHGGEPVDWAALAADLGFADQAHLTRVFTAVVGTPPATYSREA